MLSKTQSKLFKKYKDQVPRDKNGKKILIHKDLQGHFHKMLNNKNSVL